MRSVSGVSTVLSPVLLWTVLVLALVATTGRAGAFEVPTCDECQFSACDGDDVIVAAPATLLPPRQPPHDFRFEPPLQAGRLVVPDVFRPPTARPAV